MEHETIALPPQQSDEQLDRITRLAANALGTPIAMLNLIDPMLPAHQFMRSSVGLDVACVATMSVQLDDGLCQHLVGHAHAIAIDDMRQDTRFHDSVAGCLMGAVAYCGTPLLDANSGEVRGALCVVDIMPRRWSARDIELLQGLAALAQGCSAAPLPAPLERWPDANPALSEAMPAWFVEHATVGFVALDMQGNLLWANSLFERMIGSQLEEMHGRRMSEILKPWHNPGFDLTLQEVMRSGKPAVFEMHVHDGREQERFLNANISLLARQGHVNGIGIFFTEASDRRKNERDLRLAEEKLALTCEAANLGLWFWDLRTDRLEWTERCRAIFGLLPDAAINYEIFIQRVHPEDRAQMELAVQTSLQQRSGFRAVFRVQLAEGDTRWVESRGRPFSDPHGDLVHFMGAMVDVTDIKLSEMALQAKSEALLSLNDRLTELVEIRTAELQRLSQYLIELAEKEKAQLARELHDELGAYLTVVQMEIAAALRKTEDKTSEIATHLSRARATILETTTLKRRIIEGLRPSMLESLGLTEALLAYIDQYAQSANIRCTPAIEQDFLELDPNLSIALYRIAQESLTNVAKYAEASEVTVRLERVGDSVVLDISDNGKGLPEDYRERATAHGISGMQQRAARFGGVFSIMARSDGPGTRVTVVIPLPS